MQFRLTTISTIIGILLIPNVVFADLSTPNTILIDAHAKFECAICHKTATPTDIPTNETCLSCHGSLKSLQEATSKYTLNPHYSPHWGNEIPCSTCHKQHSKPIVQCEACHHNQNYIAR